MDGCRFKEEMWNLWKSGRMYFESVLRPLMEFEDLTILYLKVLAEIEGKRESTVGSVAEKLGFTNGNTSAICKRMEAEGYLERVRSPKDERYVHLIITEKGNQVMKTVHKKLNEKHGSVLEAVSPQDYETMLSGMHLLNTLFMKICEEEKNKGDQT